MRSTSLASAVVQRDIVARREREMIEFAVRVT